MNIISLGVVVTVICGIGAVSFTSFKNIRNIETINSETCSKLQPRELYLEDEKFRDGPHGSTDDILDYAEILTKEHSSEILNNGFLSYGDVFYICDLIKKGLLNKSELADQERSEDRIAQIKRIKN
jgi:hypothetical protein